MRSRADGFKDYVLDQLRDLPGVTARAMFGGYGLRRGDTFFGIVFQCRLYLKVSPGTISRYKEFGMKPFRVSARQTLRTYYEVPPDILEDAESLAQWAGQSAGTR